MRANISGVTGAILVGALLGFGVLSCSSTPKAVKYDAATNPGDELNKLAQEVNQGYSSHYDIIDDEDFTKAQNELQSARDQEARGANQEKVLKTLGYARAYLDKTKARANELQDKMQGILDARTAALNVGVRKFPAEAVDLKATDDAVRSEIKNLDKGKMTSRRWAELQAAYMNLELRSIQDAKLGQARAKIEGARKNGAEKNTPNTLKQTEFNWQNAANMIASDRHNDEKIQPYVDKAEASAQSLTEILSATKQPGGRVSEAVATDLVNQGHKILALSQKVDEKVSEADRKDQELAQQSQQIKNSQAALSLNQVLENARKELKTQDADVYRQGNKLLIRLKGMNFASGRSDLPSKALPLLSKIKEITEQLKPQQVIIEGHTDSTGSAATNLTLSQSRAEAVANYFETNGIERDKVEAVGYGFKKPIVSNKTKVGRATNRRVDIIITPTTPGSDNTHAQSM